MRVSFPRKSCQLLSATERKLIERTDGYCSNERFRIWAKTFFPAWRVLIPTIYCFCPHCLSFNRIKSLSWIRISSIISLGKNAIFWIAKVKSNWLLLLCFLSMVYIDNGPIWTAIPVPHRCKVKENLYTFKQTLVTQGVYYRL